MAPWESLLERTLKGLDACAGRGIPVKWWTFGGGTALMTQLGHRDSKDIDVFLADPQYLPYLSPRFGDDMWDTRDYREGAISLKLAFPEGEVDFIAGQAISDLAENDFTFRERTISRQHPAEIVLKKLYYRGDDMTIRDLFDTSVVAASQYRERLLDNLDLLSGRKADIQKRFSMIHGDYLLQSLARLDVRPRWKWIIPQVKRRVGDLIDQIPAPGAKPDSRKIPDFPVPDFPKDTHLGTFSLEVEAFVVREIDPVTGEPGKIGNTLEPAIVAQGVSKYFVHGECLTHDEWSKHRCVVSDLPSP